MSFARFVQYEPGKRHWLKVKKDYLQDGMMADSADLVILGADTNSQLVVNARGDAVC